MPHSPKPEAKQDQKEFDKDKKQKTCGLQTLTALQGEAMFHGNGRPAPTSTATRRRGARLAEGISKRS